MFGAVARRVSCRLLVCIVLILLCPRGAAASSSGFVYALQTTGGPSQIYGFRLDLRTGALSLLPGFPMASGGIGNAGGSAPQMVLYPHGRLYVLTHLSTPVSAFAANPITGTFTPLPLPPLPPSLPA